MHVTRPQGVSLGSFLVENGYAVIVPDLRGHGNSGPKPQEGYQWTFDDIVLDIQTYIEVSAPLLSMPPLSYQLSIHFYF